MVKWQQITERCDPESWNRDLSESEDGNIFQSFEWGEFKRASGWIPTRWVAKDSNHSVVGMVQLLTKPCFGVGTVGWAPGGPVMLFPRTRCAEVGALLKDLLDQTEVLGWRRCIRFYSLALHEGALAYSLSQVCVRPMFVLNTGYSVRLNLLLPLDVLKKQMSAKHRYYVRKALSEKIDWKVGRDAGAARDFLALHAEMIQAKQTSFRAIAQPELAALCDSLGPHATFLTGYMEGVAMTSCLVLAFGRKAFYLMAATGRMGRQVSASYAMVAALLEHLQQQGVTELDFGGIDPRPGGSEGVNHFKRGFGGNIVEYLGEWEWSNSKWLRLGMNVNVRSRRDQL